MTQAKTSVMEINIGKHEHEVMIFDSYENYAVCKLCGMHDWSVNDEGEAPIEFFQKKYPKHEVVPMDLV